MSDEGEKTCPLCAEEMDLTDQQLKPCRCGYEICVWCWHHIMEMAEKDETEGRCPACRTPYDKEKIVGTENCGRVVADVNIDKKQKSQKARVKTSESRKQLSTVRVIQRNLVYIVGLPLDFADEDLLQCRDYFGQYGKVLKVSISRTSAGTIQQFANDTCSVYITYSSEEEAVRCIQSVHGFILDGRPLRACFGTTKYCHAWLRNVPCTNADCLYLHEVGSQEDSFTKDEIISAYTRSRVQQITGVTYNMQRRSGDMLPPPTDDHNFNNSGAATGQPVPKNSSNNSIRSSPPTCSYARSGALPAAASWGSRASTCNQPAVSMASANGPTKQKAEVTPPSELSTAISGGSQSSTLPTDVGKKLTLSEVTNGRQSVHKLEIQDTPKHQVGVNSQTDVLKVSTPLDTPVLKSTSQQSCPPATDSQPGDGNMTLNNELAVEQQPSLDMENSGSSVNDGNIQNLRSAISSLSTDNRLIEELSDTSRPNGLCLNNFLSPRSPGLPLHESEKLREHSTPAAVSRAVGESAFDSLSVANEVCDQLSNVKSPGIPTLTHESEDDFDSQRLGDAIVVSQTSIPTPFQLHLFSHLRGSSQQHSPATVNCTVNSPMVNRMHDEGLVSNVSAASNGFIDNPVSRGSGPSNSSLVNSEQGNRMTGIYDVRSGNGVYQPAAPDMGESSIISNILNLDSWDDSLTSPLNLAKLLGETDRQEGSMKLENSWKGNSDQSRFSFARQEESRNHLFDFSSASNISGQSAHVDSFGQAFENREPFMGRHGTGFSFPQRYIEPPENFTSGCLGLPSSKLPSSSVSRSQISAPPGFSVRSRPPPPGFPSHEKSDQTYDMQSASSLRNTFHPSPNSNMSTFSDIEFIDPAILAVGKGRLPNGINNSGIDMSRSNFHVHNPSFEHDSRLQLLLQRSLPPQENVRYRDVKDNYSPPDDSYNFTSRYMSQSPSQSQSQSSNISPYSQLSFQQARNIVVSNGHWDGWGEIQSANSMGMSELLRNDGSGFSKYRMATSGDLYNSSFRM